MAKELKLAFIIPAIGRDEKLKKLLNNIENQSVKPALIVIVDSGLRCLKNEIRYHNFPIMYIHTGPNSLTEARNIGIRNIPEDIHLIGFLDDDVTLGRDATELMVDFWQEASPDIGGVAFNIVNNRKPRKLWFLKSIFLTGSRYPGDVLPSGYVTTIENVKSKIYPRWLPGGATVWRKDILDKFQFDENLKGYGFYEDVDFSYKVSKDYKLLVLAQAKSVHKSHPAIDGEKNIDFGVYEILNRFHFINKHKEFSKILFYWASLGNFLENIFSGVFGFNSNYFKRALGNLLGIKRITFKNRRGGSAI